MGHFRVSHTGLQLGDNNSSNNRTFASRRQRHIVQCNAVRWLTLVLLVERYLLALRQRALRTAELKKLVKCAGVALLYETITATHTYHKAPLHCYFSINTTTQNRNDNSSGGNGHSNNNGTQRKSKGIRRCACATTTAPTHTHTHTFMYVCI